MKHLVLAMLLITGLTGCANINTDPIHAAVITYLKKTLNDPASYVAVRWSKPERYTRRDSAAAAAERLSAEYDKTKVVELVKQAIRLEAVTDTTRIGTFLIHTYRTKNRLGATVLDSTRFLIYKNGRVQQL